MNIRTVHQCLVGLCASIALWSTVAAEELPAATEARADAQVTSLKLAAESSERAAEEAASAIAEDSAIELDLRLDSLTSSVVVVEVVTIAAN